MKFNGKTVWLTGASSGIGEALVHELAKEDIRLIISARRREELERVRQSAGLTDDKCLVLPLDLADINSLQLASAQALERFGRVDVLIHNGGISQRSLAVDTGIEVDRKLMEVNYFGTVALTKILLPKFIAQKECLIIVVTSAVGRIPSPWRSGYAASKHALHGFFDSLRAENYDDGLRVLLVCPGFIQTNVSVNALTGNGRPLGTMDNATKKGLTAGECARQIIKAAKSGKEEVVISGFLEGFAVWCKRHFPALFSVLIRKMSVR
jgi:dehydrogenase/reductase SDR family protein 7B